MQKTLAIIAVCLVGAWGQGEENFEPAPYEVLEVKDGYEVRQYPPTKWVSTDRYSIFVYDSEDFQSAFRDLVEYIEGLNSFGVKVEMTTPVTTYIIPGAGPNCEQNFTMAFYIPEKYQQDPPLPLGPGVYIEDRPAYKATALSFSGYAGDKDFIDNARKLLGLVTEDVDAEEYYTAVYDGPYVIIDRHNEVIFRIKE